MADSSIFSILDIPILAGKKNSLFSDKSDIVLSERAALKYFGNQNPVGKSLDINMSGEITQCTISGIYKNFPSYSSLQPDFIGNIKLAFHVLRNSTLTFGNTQEISEQDLQNSWEQRGFQTFIWITGNSTTSIIEKKCSAIYQSHEKQKEQKAIHLQEFSVC